MNVMDENKWSQNNTAYVPSVITPSTFAKFIWDSCDHNWQSIFGDTLKCTNGIIVQRKEISSYARVELTHEAVSAVENSKNASILCSLKDEQQTVLVWIGFFYNQWLL